MRALSGKTLSISSFPLTLKGLKLLEQASRLSWPQRLVVSSPLRLRDDGLICSTLLEKHRGDGVDGGSLVKLEVARS